MGSTTNRLKNYIVVASIACFAIGMAFAVMGWSRDHFLSERWERQGAENGAILDRCLESGIDWQVCFRRWEKSDRLGQGFAYSAAEARYRAAMSASFAVAIPAVLWAIYFGCKWRFSRRLNNADPRGR